MNEIKVRQKFFSKEYEKVFNRYIINWCVSVFCVGSVVALFSIPIDGIWLFDVLAKITPGIEKWTEATNHRDVAKAVWLYMTYSSFFILPRMIYLIEKVNINNAFAFFIVFSMITYFTTIFFINGSFMDKEIHLISDSNKRMLLYRTTDFGCIFISCLIGAAFILSWLHVLLGVIEFFNCRKLFIRR